MRKRSHRTRWRICINELQSLHNVGPFMTNFLRFPLWLASCQNITFVQWYFACTTRENNNFESQAFLWRQNLVHKWQWWIIGFSHLKYGILFLQDYKYDYYKIALWNFQRTSSIKFNLIPLESILMNFQRFCTNY